jgi:hypothetical protein
MQGKSISVPNVRGTAVAILVAAGGLLNAGARASSGDEDTSEKVLARVQSALGWKAGGTFLVEGEAEMFTSKGSFALSWGPAGAFREQVDAPLGYWTGDDSHGGWQRDASGMTRTTEGAERDRRRLVVWVRTGQWLDPALTLTAERRPQDQDGLVVLALKLGSGSAATAHLSLDQATWLPRSLTVRGGGMSEALEFSDYLEHEGRKLAGTVVHRVDGFPVASYRVKAIHARPPAESTFEAPRTGPDDTRFERDKAATIRLDRARTGHLLVRPTVDGVALGPFILDSGAAGSVIAKSSAAKLGLPTVGRRVLKSILGSNQAPVYRAKSFGLGPVTIANPTFVEMDFAPLDVALGVTLEGIIGYDLFSRCVVDLTLAENSMTLRVPDDPALGKLPWVPMTLPWGHPAVPARFADGPEGPFRLDLGAASGPAGNVTFHSTTVTQFRMLEGRSVTRAKAGTLDIAVGQVPWFELAGHRFERPQVLFALDDEGVLGDVGTLGNIGVEFLRPFRVVFDYSHKRIAFVSLANGE